MQTEPSDGKPSKGNTIAKASGLMVISLTLSRVLGLIRDTVIASTFGLTALNDSYRIAMQIPEVIFMLIAGGGLGSAFIPVFSEFLHTDREEDAKKLLSAVVTLCITIGTFVVGVAWVLSPQIVAFFGDGQAPDVLARAVVMSRILLPAQIAFLAGSVLLGGLQSRGNFSIPALAPNIYNLGIIAGAALLPHLLGLDIVWVAWGGLSGAVLGSFLIPAAITVRDGFIRRPSWDYRAPGVGRFFKLLIPVLIGFSLPSMMQLITQKFASGFGESANTVLAYSINLMMAPLGIFGQSLSLAAFPVLAQFVAQNRMDQYRSQVSKTFRTILYLTIPSAALMYALAPLLVHIIYGYGKAGNDVAQLDAIAYCLRIYCIAIPAWCVQPILMRGFFSLHQTFLPIAISTAMTALFIVACVILRTNPLGIEALPWASNVCATLLVVCLFTVLQRKTGSLELPLILASAVKSIAAAALMGGFLYGVSTLWTPAARLGQIGYFLFIVTVGAWIYYYATRAMKMTETEYLDKVFAKLARKSR